MFRFDQRLKSVLAAQHDYLSDTERQIYANGKRLRPILLLLSARLNQRGETTTEPLPDRIITAAVSIEMLHVASLIHDDIIDVASVRRGAPTINSIRGNEMALLIGDLQFIEAARTFARFADARQDIEVFRRYLDTAYHLCRGQLDELQTELPFSPSALLKRYVRTIDRKTGRLIAFACEGGARLAGATVANTSSMNRFGVHFGRAFQMMDDVLDLVQDAPVWGKGRFQDLMQRRLSLPIILEMGRQGPDASLWRYYCGEELQSDQLQEIGRKLAFSDSLFEAYSLARIQAQEAEEAMFFLPEGEPKQLLKELAAHVVNQGFLDRETKLAEWRPNAIR